MKDFRGKIEPLVGKGVLKIERYAQRLTQGYSAHGGSYLWAPAHAYFLDKGSSLLSHPIDFYLFCFVFCLLVFVSKAKISICNFKLSNPCVRTSR